MKYLQVKNYRSIENAEFLLGIENYFVGDNNTGKSSLLRLIESIFKNTKLNFEGTYLGQVAINDLKYDDEVETIDIFYGNSDDSFSRWNEDKITDTKPLLFEYLEIGSLPGYEYPLIKKIASSFKTTENIICFFEINYILIDGELKIESVIISEYENTITKNLEKYAKNLNLIEKFKELFINKDLKKAQFKFDSEIIKEKKQNFRKREDKDKEKNTSFFLRIFELEFLLKPNSNLDINSLYKCYFLSDMYESKQKEHLCVHHLNSWRLQNHSGHAKYVNPLRPMFKEFYSLNEADFGTVDSLISYTKKNNFIVEKINYFLKNSNMAESISIDSNKIWNTKLYFPVYEKNGKKMKLSMSGTGVSQVVPILFAIYNSNNYKLFIEQPEVHLHPRAQSLLGELFSDYYFEHSKRKLQKLTFTNQLFIETHSMYLLDRLRYKISQQNTLTENNEIEELDISVFFLENLNSKVEIETLKILSNGKYKGNVDKFLKYFIDELVESFTV